jgi:WD40 repeat protein
MSHSSVSVYINPFASDYERMAEKASARVQTLGYRGNYRLFRTLRVNQRDRFSGGDRHLISFSPDGHFLAACGSDRTIRLWDVSSGNELQTLRSRADITDQIRFAFSPDGRSLASYQDNIVTLWDLPLG